MVSAASAVQCSPQEGGKDGPGAYAAAYLLSADELTNANSSVFRLRSMNPQ
jgi:hypothetical protein